MLCIINNEIKLNDIGKDTLIISMKDVFSLTYTCLIFINLKTIKIVEKIAKIRIDITNISRTILILSKRIKTHRKIKKSPNLPMFLNNSEIYNISNALKTSKFNIAIEKGSNVIRALSKTDIS